MQETEREDVLQVLSKEGISSPLVLALGGNNVMGATINTSGSVGKVALKVTSITLDTGSTLRTN